MSAPSYDQIYDIETPLEEAVASKLREAGFFVITRRNVSQEFQQQRPRCEVRVNLGGPTSQAHFHLIPETLEQHIDMFKFTLQVQVVTELTAAAANMQLPTYRARVRRLLGGAEKTLIDNDLLPYHFICRIWTAGTDYVLDQETGTEYSTLNYEGEVMIRASAWLGSNDVDVLGTEEQFVIGI